MHSQIRRKPPWIKRRYTYPEQSQSSDEPYDSGSNSETETQDEKSGKGKKTKEKSEQQGNGKSNDERVFSFTGKTSSGQRGGMSATKLEQLTIVGKNWDLCPGHIVRDRGLPERGIASCEGCCGKEYDAECAKQEPLEGLDGSLQEDV